MDFLIQFFSKSLGRENIILLLFFLIFIWEITSYFFVIFNHIYICTFRKKDFLIINFHLLYYHIILYYIVLFLLI